LHDFNKQYELIKGQKISNKRKRLPDKNLNTLSSVIEK
jgi:hypothetical protein